MGLGKTLTMISLIIKRKQENAAATSTAESKDKNKKQQWMSKKCQWSHSIIIRPLLHMWHSPVSISEFCYTSPVSGLEIHGGKVVNYHQTPQNYHQLLKLVVRIYHHILNHIYHRVSDLRDVLVNGLCYNVLIQRYRRHDTKICICVLRWTQNPLTAVNMKTVRYIVYQVTFIIFRSDLYEVQNLI